MAVRKKTTGRIWCGSKWLPARIVALRKRLGVTHDEFAMHLGVNVRSVYRWEAEVAKPSRLAVRLLEELDKR